MRGIKSSFNFQRVSHGLSRDCEKGEFTLLHYIRRNQLIIMAMSSTVAQGCVFQACLTAFALISASFLVPWVPEIFSQLRRTEILRFDGRHRKLRKKNLWHPEYLSCARRESAHNMLLALETELSTSALIHFLSSPASFLRT